jgi:hypothetical protein
MGEGTGSVDLGGIVPVSDNVQACLFVQSDTT